MTKHYDYVFEHLPTPIWIKSLSNELIYINQSFVNLFQINPDKVLYEPLEILVSSASYPYTEQLYKSMQTATRAGTYTIKTDLGLFRHIIFAYKDKVTQQDILLGLLLTADELTSSTQNNLFKTIINNVPEIIFYKDHRGRYEGANQACKDFYQSKGINDFLGKTDYDLPLDPDFVDGCTSHDRIVINSQKPLVFEESIISKDGTSEIFETIKTPVFDDDGNVWGIVGVVRDITLSKKLEDKLRHLSYTDALSGLYNRAYFDEMMTTMTQEELFPIGFILGDVNGLKIVNDTLGHLAGDSLIQAIASQLRKNTPEKSLVFRWGGDEFVILIPHSNETECQQIIDQISSACEASTCENIKLSMALGYSLFNDKSDNIDQIMRLTEDKLYRQKMLNSKSLRSSILSSLQNSLEAKNIETSDHTSRVVAICKSIGQALGLDSAQLDEVALVAKLHDIGKIGIPESILLKPTHLTPEEFEVIKAHSEKGYRLTSLFPELSHIARGILTHHEKWDGAGYPLGLRGEEIPLVARIVAVADSYDAMTNNRIYNCIKTKGEALEELKCCSGKHFDPQIVSIFCELT